MTRINLCPVSELMDQHLNAECREILRVPRYIRRSLNTGNFKESDIPNQFTLGEGHVKFFYNKGLWLEKRFDSLQLEMIKRGMNPNLSFVYDTELFRELNFYNDWSPSEGEIAISRQRIAEMIAIKPGWYRKTPTDGWINKIVMWSLQ